MAVKGYWNEDKEAWNKIRVQTAFLLQPHSKKTINPKKLMPFEGERVDKATDKESFLRAMEFFRRKSKVVKTIN